jgi:mannose-1-phosphate guanylyltransferase
MRSRWAIVLAGGDGTRLQSVTSSLMGEPTPKQFCRFFGGRTLVDDTINRLAPIVDSARMALLLTRDHERHYEALRASRPASLMLEQPANRGTGIGMAFGIGRIRRRDPDAVVGFFPADHHYQDVAAFGRAVSMAYLLAALTPDRLVLVGAAPLGPEPDYGWIQPGRPVEWPASDGRIFDVSRFWEKPDASTARTLFTRRCVWNTFITVGTVRAFRAAFAAGAPDLGSFSDSIAEGSTVELDRTAEACYAGARSRCFSAEVLTRVPDHCSLVTMAEAGFVDVGRPDRLASVQSRFGRRTA